MTTTMAHLLAQFRNLVMESETLDVATMSKRVDALCAPNSHVDVAEWLDVDAQAVEALRQGRVSEPDSSALFAALIKLAEATGASIDWILGNAHAVVDDSLRLDVDLLVSLDALLQTRSVAKAAARVRCLSLVMDRRLANLRELFGDPLLVGSGSSVLLTPRARALAPRVRRIVADIRKLATAGYGTTPGRVRLMRLYRRLQDVVARVTARRAGRPGCLALYFAQIAQRFDRR